MAQWVKWFTHKHENLGSDPQGIHICKSQWKIAIPCFSLTAESQGGGHWGWLVSQSRPEDELHVQEETLFHKIWVESNRERHLALTSVLPRRAHMHVYVHNTQKQ